MRIVCTVTNDLAQDQRMDRICRSLVSAGHEVTLVGRQLPTSKPLPDRPYKMHRITCRNHSGKAFYLEYNYRLWVTLRKWDFDAICAVDLDTLVAGWLLKSKRRKLVYDAHEWFSETPEVVGRPLTQAVWRSVGRWLVPRTDARYSVATILAGKLSDEYNSPFEVVRNLPVHLSPDRFAVSYGGSRERGDEAGRADENKAENKAEVKTILYQGMLNPGRGLEEMIRALQWLPDCRLLVVGSGPLEGALRRCEEEVEVRGRVEWAGFRPPEELPEITRGAWLGVNLLDAVSPSYYYSLANKALDYVQAGVPSIQMDFPEYRMLHDQYDCYQLVENLNPEKLAAAIQELADDPGRYAALRANCLAAARELCWEREEEVLLGIWAGLEA